MCWKHAQDSSQSRLRRCLSRDVAPAPIVLMLSQHRACAAFLLEILMCLSLKYAEKVVFS